MVSSMSWRLFSREKAAVGGQENLICQKGPSVPICRETTEDQTWETGTASASCGLCKTAQAQILLPFLAEQD